MTCLAATNGTFLDGGDMVGQGGATRTIFATLERIAVTNAPVLIGRKTGTGTELGSISPRCLQPVSAKSQPLHVVLALPGGNDPTTRLVRPCP